MKNEYAALKKRLGREGIPFPARAPGRGMLALGMDQARAEELGLPGESLGLTKTVGSSSITLEGVIGSGQAYYFPFTVTGLEGSVLGSPEGCSFDHAYVLV